MHGSCRSPVRTRAEHAGVRSAGLAPAERAAHERLTDAERDDATELLGAAFRDGILGLDEFDTRLEVALRAAVVGDLAPVTGDLPAHWLAEREAVQAAQRRAARHRRRWSAEVRTYARVMALLVGIWLLTSLLTAEIRYPWPIWPALGWGIPLFLGRPSGPTARTVGRLRTARGL
jgi:hypothetical protein